MTVTLPQTLGDNSLTQLVSALEAKLKTCVQNNLWVHPSQLPQLATLTVMRDSRDSNLSLSEVRPRTPSSSPQDPMFDSSVLLDHQRRRKPG